MYVCMDGWVDGWVGGWMDGWMDGCVQDVACCRNCAYVHVCAMLVCVLHA